MFLVEILLPADPNTAHRHTRGVLTDKFGGVTAFNRSPATGLWKNGGSVKHDEIVVLEIMASTIDATWWKEFRISLEQALKQDEIIIRYHVISRL